MTRQVVLDTETTGMPVEDGHRVIEVGCVELVDGKQGFHFHTYINPGPGARMDEEALQVHGITLEFLKTNRPLPRLPRICLYLLTAPNWWRTMPSLM